MNALIPRARFDLPQNWTPAGTVCVKIPCPDDPQYITMLMGLVTELTWSYNFQRDDTTQGAATVSRTWLAALNSTPMVVEGCEDMPAFRINPETCLLEVDCGGDNWKPVYTPDYDPTQDAPVPPPPYPDPPPEGTTNECIAASNATEFMKSGTHQFALLLDNDHALGLIAGLLYTLLSQLVSVLQANIYLSVLSIDWGSFDYETILQDYEVFDWDDLKCMLLKYYADNGEMTIAKHIEALADMDNQAGQIWRLIRLVWSLMGSVGATYASLWAGITVEADCAACAWEHTFDFALGAQGWESIVSGGRTQAQLEAQGWTYDLSGIDGNGNHYYNVAIQRAVAPATSINRITVYAADVTRGDYLVFYPDHIMVNGVIVEAFGNTDEGTFTFQWDGGIAATSIAANLTLAVQNTEFPVSGDGFITKIVVAGSGDDPF